MDGANLPPGDLLNLAGVLAGLAALWIAFGRGWRKWGRPQEWPMRRVDLGGLDIVAGLGLMAGGIAALGIVGRKMGLALPDGDGASGPMSAKTLAWFQLLAQGLVQLPLTLYVIVRLGARPDRLRQEGLLPRQPKRELLIGVLAYPVIQLLVMFALQAGAVAAELLHRAPPPTVAHESLRQMQQAGLSGTGLLLIGSALVAAPLEEIMFRGLLQTALQNMFNWAYRWPVVLGVALVFAAIHYQAAHWATLPGLFVLGLALGVLYEWTGSLLPGIMVHLLFNAFNMVVVLIGLAG